jgi:hypothetical protein
VTQRVVTQRLLPGDVAFESATGSAGRATRWVRS